jgi:hypothetical protein
MNEDERTKVSVILHECDVHAGRIEYARSVCSTFFPLTAETYRALSDEQIAHIDQLIYRYTKLQDSLGAKLFPLIVAQIREDAESLTILDKLDQLERIDAIADAERWQELRELRNQLAHDYEDDAATAVGYLNDMFDTSSVLQQYYKQATRFARDRILSSGRDG